MPIWDFTSYLLSNLRDAEAESNRVHDTVVGIVVDIKDPDQLQRVKVRFPSLGPDATWWCSRVAPGAGKDRGWFTAPEIDDEVVVGFEHGELARPIILGAIWNGKDAPPDGNPDGDNPRRTIASKSGHVVLFDDKDGTLTIADGAGIGVVIFAKDGGITIEANQGDVAMQAKTELSIYAGQIEINATGNIDLCGKSSGVDASGASVKVDGNMVALKGSAIDINPGGVPKAAKASGEVSEVPGSDPGTNSPAQVSGGDEGSASGGGAGSSSASAGGAAGSDGAADDDALRVLTRDGVKTFRGGYYAGPMGAEASTLIADDPTKKPLVTAATWADGEHQWNTRRAWTTLDAAVDPSFGALTIEAQCENLTSVTIKVMVADESAVLATATAPVSGGKASWRFEPKAHGLKTCADIIAEVSGGGSTATTKEVAHVHQPYWQSPDSSLRYELTWPPRKEKSTDGSGHYVDDVVQVTLDEAGQANLKAWESRLSLYMRAHTGVNIATITQAPPRCRFDVRDLQSDLGQLGLWFDSEQSLTGAGFSTRHTPSGVHGPLTFLGLTVLDRLSMFDTNTPQVPSGAYRAGQPATLTGAEKQKYVAPGKSYTPPMKVDARLAKVIRAWRIGKLTPQLDGAEFEQVPIKWHNGSTFKVQRRQAKKLLTWLYAIEGAGGFLEKAGPRRDWRWPLWRRYANKRSPASTHYCGLAADLADNQGAVTPMDRYVVHFDPGPMRFDTYQNLTIAKKDAAKKGYPDQSAAAATLGLAAAVVGTTAKQKVTRVDAALKKGPFSGYLETRRKDLVARAKDVEKKLKAAAKAADAAGAQLFGSNGTVDTDADRALVDDLLRGKGTPAQLAAMTAWVKETGAVMVLAARGRAYAATLDGLKALHAVVSDAASPVKGPKAIAAYDAGLAALDRQIDTLVAKLQSASGGAAAVTAARASTWVRNQAAQPWDFDPSEPTPPPAASQLDAASRADLTELLMLLGERAVRADIQARLQSINADADVVILPIDGEFVRIDNLVQGKEKLYRIGRSGDQWEWWHFQFPDPGAGTRDLDILAIEMAREIGVDGIIQMIQSTESLKAALAAADKEHKRPFAASQYAWWAGLHPNEVGGDTYASGFNLAELLLGVH